MLIIGFVIGTSVLTAIFLAILPGEKERLAKARERRLAEAKMNARLLRMNL